MSNAAKAFDLLKSIGVFEDMRKVSSLWNSGRQSWELTGSFQNANGRLFGKVAEFDTADDIVEFEMLCEQMIRSR